MNITFTAVKDSTIWVFDHEHNNTKKEPLCNGTETVLDEYFKLNMGRSAVQNDRIRITADTEPFVGYDTELHLQSTNDEGSIYLDMTLYEKVWLCPWLQSYFLCVPTTLFVKLTLEELAH